LSDPLSPQALIVADRLDLRPRVRSFPVGSALVGIRSALVACPGARPGV